MMDIGQLCLDQAAEIERLNEQVAMLRESLGYYAEQDHFTLYEPEAWDTVSGEPENLLCDEAGTAMVENGSIAARAFYATGSNWLANKLRESRDGAIEEVAIATWKIKGLGQYGRNNFREEIRAMKGKP